MTQPVPDWVTQQMLAAGQPGALPAGLGWGQAGSAGAAGTPQTPEEAAMQAGMLPTTTVLQPPVAPAPIATAPAPMSVDPNATMSTQPEPVASELNYTPAPPPEAAPVAPQQQLPQVNPIDENLSRVMASYLRGRQGVIPASVQKAAEQWSQSTPSAMPGQEQAYQQAQTELQDTENDALLDQRLNMMNAADRYDNQARLAYLQGRGQADQLIKVEEERAQRAAVIDSRIQELDKLIDDRTQAAAVNPVEKFWSDMGTAGRIATAIAIGFGAFGQSINGGPNTALDIVNRRIDGEIAKQKQVVDTIGNNIAGKRLILGDMLQKFRDPVAADHAARAAMLGMVEAQYRGQAATEKSAELRNNMNALADQVALQRAEQKQQALQAEHRTLIAWRPAQVVGTPGGMAGLTRFGKDFNLTPEQERKLKLAAASNDHETVMGVLRGAMSGAGTMTKDELNQARFDQDHRVRLSDGTLGFVKDKTDYEKTVTSLNKMDANLGRLQKFVESGSAWSPTDRANVEAITNMAMGEIRVMLGLGVMSESDKDLAKSLTGDFVNDRLSVADKRKRLEMLASLTSQTRREYEARVSRDPNALTPAVKPIRSERAQ